MATVYDVVTERIIAQLEQGTGPWHRLASPGFFLTVRALARAP